MKCGNAENFHSLTNALNISMSASPSFQKVGRLNCVAKRKESELIASITLLRWSAYLVRSGLKLQILKERWVRIEQILYVSPPNVLLHIPTPFFLRKWLRQKNNYSAKLNSDTGTCAACYELLGLYMRWKTKTTGHGKTLKCRTARSC